jgi:transcriptional regulator with XRE-family HTH domain
MPVHIEFDMVAVMYGAFIRELRESRGLSQTDLAAVSGVRQPNISAIEQDRREPGAATLHRLVAACGYELGAVAGSAAVHLPPPLVGWFDDDGLPPRLPDDPPDEPPTVTATTSAVERNRILVALLASVHVAPRR